MSIYLKIGLFTISFVCIILFKGCGIPTEETYITEESINDNKTETAVLPIPREYASFSILRGYQNE
tara:strand:+ start:3382 stop:3579 length:198 start_codon:yes stop_codon:yes gene_type:complete